VYHIKDDPRSIKSANLLYAGLMECLKKKPLAKVTVTDVTKVSTVGRATFYRSFDEVPDILAWRCNLEFEKTLSSFVASNPPMEKEDELLLYVLRHWMSSPKILEVLIDAGRLDIIFNAFVNNAHIIMDFLESRGIDMKTDDFEYFISVRAGFFIGIIRAWVACGKTQTPEEVARIVAEQHDQVKASELLV
jgi:AcrR family transcriptional regulator